MLENHEKLAEILYQEPPALLSFRYLEIVSTVALITIGLLFSAQPFSVVRDTGAPAPRGAWAGEKRERERVHRK